MLQLEQVQVFYGQSQALFDVSLQVGEREFVTIIGPNGAGKTTLARAIMGLVPLHSGRITFDGVDLGQMKAWDRAALGIGYVPEGRRVFPFLSVEENLRLGAYKVRDPQQIARNRRRVFDLFPRLEERRRQVAHTLSGGEQQMLAIGRALMVSPRLLLIDEISMGLMPSLVNQVFKVLAELNADGLAVLLIEQNVRMALDAAHRGYVLEGGRVPLEGEASFLQSNRHVVQAYLGADDAGANPQAPVEEESRWESR